MNDLFDGLLNHFNPISDNDTQSTVGCFGCGKGKNNTNPNSRRIRAQSQTRIKGIKYFNINPSILRSKSREFRQVIPQVKTVRARSKMNIEEQDFKAKQTNENIVRAGSSQDIITSNSSKPYSKIQTETKDSNNKSSGMNY